MKTRTISPKYVFSLLLVLFSVSSCVLEVGLRVESGGGPSMSVALAPTNTPQEAIIPPSPSPTLSPIQIPPETVTPLSNANIATVFPSSLPICPEASQGMNAVATTIDRYFRNGEYHKALACAKWLYQSVYDQARLQQRALLASGQCGVNPTDQGGMGRLTYLAKYQALSHIGATFIDVGKIYFESQESEQTTAAWRIAADEFSCAWVDEGGGSDRMWNVGERAKALLGIKQGE